MARHRKTVSVIFADLVWRGCLARAVGTRMRQRPQSLLAALAVAGHPVHFVGRSVGMNPLASYAST